MKAGATTSLYLIAFSLLVITFSSCQKHIPEPGEESLELPSTQPQDDGFQSRASQALQKLGEETVKKALKTSKQIKDKDFLRGLNPEISKFEAKISKFEFGLDEVSLLKLELKKLEDELKKISQKESLGESNQEILRTLFFEFSKDYKKLIEIYELQGN